MLKVIPLFVATFIVFTGCKLSEKKSNFLPKYIQTSIQSGGCSIKEQNQYVYNFMKERYLWYKTLPELDPNEYESPYALLNKLRYKLDRWSFIIDKKVLENYFNNGGYVGYGFKLALKENRLYVTEVYPNSPADKAKIKRGDEILKINNKDVASMSVKELNEALGANKKGVQADFLIQRQKQTRSVTLQKKEIYAPSVMKAVVLEQNNEKIGYMVFDKFIKPSHDELDETFNFFKNKAITKLIVDLRYNSGGMLSVAQHLASLIIGNDFANEKAFTLTFNDKRTKLNGSYYFKALPNALGLQSVYFLTTKTSCSASEAVINALKPYMDVKIFGSKTCGKPVGMVGGTFCNKYIMPIEFKIVNSQGEGDYFNGLTPTCQAEDDITHDFGDSNETLLHTALYYIANQSCPPQANKKIFSQTKEKDLFLDGVQALIGAF